MVNNFHHHTTKRNKMRAYSTPRRADGFSSDGPFKIRNRKTFPPRRPWSRARSTARARTPSPPVSAHHAYAGYRARIRLSASSARPATPRTPDGGWVPENGQLDTFFRDSKGRTIFMTSVFVAKRRNVRGNDARRRDELHRHTSCFVMASKRYSSQILSPPSSTAGLARRLFTSGALRASRAVAAAVDDDAVAAAAARGPRPPRRSRRRRRAVARSAALAETRVAGPRRLSRRGGACSSPRPRAPARR